MLRSTKLLLNRPGLIGEGSKKVDPYSEILSGLKLKGAIFFRGEFSAPWFINAPPSPQLAAALGLQGAHVVNFHLLTEGEARVELPAGSTLGLIAGEIVIFPHGDAHYLMSTDGACRVEDAAVATKVRARDLSPLRCGGGGAPAKFVCGYMACDPFFCSSVVSGLPPVISVNIRSDTAGRWMENSLLHLLEEVGSNSVGSAAVLAKLSEALFIEALRKYAARGYPSNAQAGSRLLVTATSGELWCSCIVGWRTHGPLAISHPRWACRAAPSWIASRNCYRCRP